ncbi:unnamed protein product [Durusdinium trenchii]|uniref:tRNA (guanine(9)-N(1))-methyltransferase n=1 Tax=Durusdinium trenchii TaxID=1381693 RepID=A0ABP0LY25_9DINO
MPASAPAVHTPLSFTVSVIQAFPPQPLSAERDPRQAGRDRKAFLETSLTEAFERGRPRVVVNCSFDQSMDVRELTSLAKQIQLAYTQARNMGSKVQLHLTSLGPENRAWRGLEAQGVRGWKMHLHEKSVWEVFAEEARSGKLVILTPDADEELVDVSDEEVYVIGGIVDRSVKKMQSLAQAQEFGAQKLRKLPLKSFGPKGCCPVLNVDCVARTPRGFGGSEWRTVGGLDDFWCCI